MQIKVDRTHFTKTRKLLWYICRRVTPGSISLWLITSSCLLKNNIVSAKVFNISQFFFFFCRKERMSLCDGNNLEYKVLYTYIQTAITTLQSGLQPSLSHDSCCVWILYKSSGTDCELQLYWETFHDNFIGSQSICQKSA